jgi:hypothetical protein
VPSLPIAIATNVLPMILAFSGHYLGVSERNTSIRFSTQLKDSNIIAPLHKPHGPSPTSSPMERRRCAT